MNITLHHDPWHWLHVAGRTWHRHSLTGWTTAVGMLALVAGLALMENRTFPGKTAGDHTSVGESVASHPFSALHARRAALERAEQTLHQSPAPAARLDVARCAWALARTLPVQQESEIHVLLLRADELLSDPAVIDILTPDDRCMKAHIVIALAPVMDLTNPRRNPRGMLAEGDGKADAARAPRGASARRRRACCDSATRWSAISLSGYVMVSMRVG